MEMEREEMMEEERSGFEARRRRTKSSDGGETSGGNPPGTIEEKAEGGGGEADQRSVYFDADHAEVPVAVDNNGVKLKKDDCIFTMGEPANGKSDIRTNMNDDQKVFPAEETNHIIKNTKIENGSNPQCYSTINVGEMTESEDEITVHEQTTISERSKLEVVEFDLQRILEEQDTHDLYCPNCNSCITKRVILRKRKRSSRESQRDVPSKKMHDEGTGKLDVNDTPEPDVFRCLSCFSFFIPAEGGFNIFHIFEKGKENDVQSIEPVPQKKTNWIASMFKVNKSKNKESEPEPSKSYIISSGVHHLIQKDNSSPITMTGAVRFEESQIISQKNDTAAEGVGRFGGAGDEKISGEPEFGGDSDIPVSEPSNVSFQEQLKEQTKQYDGSTEKTSTSGASIQIKDATDDGVSLRNDAEIDAIQIISQNDQIFQGSEGLLHSDVCIDVADQIGRDTELRNDWDVLKSIVYGGLIESITSLSVVSSAAGAESSTMSIIALGLANLIGGFLLIIHNLLELRTAQDEAAEQTDEQVGRYWELLGQRANFRLHFVVAIISYILVGSVPPVVYGFSFRMSDNKEYKLIAVAAASLLCVTLLAVGKAHVKPQKAYIRTLFYYLSLGVSASAISYIAGVMINSLLENLGLFDHKTPSSVLTLVSQDLSFGVSAWASY
ncbi:membrane protein of ER body-like protein [Canna indica]|uniref:Membrane protein of ER body-like protein n=1 Tax=Canna indica TaxID=4628 RepID=A0AAQ3Q458_9LILI|nr:membrane protein of ER body-like protein [Canna indica]